MGTTPHSDLAETKASEFNKNLRIVDGSTQSNSEIAISSLRSFLKLNATGDVSTIPATNNNISLSGMKNTWFPGARLSIQNEDTSTYSTYNNGIIAVSPFPGSDTNNNTGYDVDYTISVGSNSVIWNGNPAVGNIETDVGLQTSKASFNSSNVPGTTNTTGSHVAWEFNNIGPAGNGLSLSGAGNVYPRFFGTISLSAPGGGTTNTSISASLDTPTDPVILPSVYSYTVPADTTLETLFETTIPSDPNLTQYYGSTKFADVADIAFYVQISGVTDFSPQYDTIYTTHIVPANTVITLMGGSLGLTVDQLAAQYNSSPEASVTGTINVLSGGDFVPLNAQVDDDGNEYEWSAVMTAGGGDDATGDDRGNYAYFGRISGPSAKSYHIDTAISAGTYYDVELEPLNTSMSVYPAAFQVSVGYGNSADGNVKWGGDTTERPVSAWPGADRTANLSTPVIVPNKRIATGDSADNLTLSGDSVHS